MNTLLENKPGLPPNPLMGPPPQAPSPAMVLSQGPAGRQAIMPAPPVVAPPSGGAAGLLPKAAPVSAPAAAPMAPAATMASPPAPAPEETPLSWEDQVRAYRHNLRQTYPDMPEKDFENLAQYGIAKQEGRMAAQNHKVLAKPMAKYLGALQAKENAELQYQQLGEKLKHRVAEFKLPDGRMDPGFQPYKDQLDAARLGMEAKRKKVLEHRALLNKLGVKNESLASPVAIHQFFNSLATSDPAQHEENPDDSDLVDYMTQQ